MGSDASEVLKRFRKQYITVIPDKVIHDAVIADKKVVVIKPDIIKETLKSQLFMVSAYDLSFQSCQKSRSSEGFGITATGFSLKGQTRISAMTVAVDPNLIPINSKVKITFINDKYIMYNGIYRAFDQGGLIKGRKLDLFMGDFQSNKPNKQTINFGVEKAYVEIIN